MKNKIALFVIFSLLVGLKSNAQWQSTMCTTISGTGYLQNNGNDIIFGTNCNWQMDLQVGTGFLGIGNTFAPSYLLDVYGGDINTSSTGNQVAYRIGGDRLLWHNGDITCLYSGVYANHNATSGIPRCTFLGGGTGYHITSGPTDNTLVGYNAGYWLNGSFNTFIGSQAGFFQAGNDVGPNTYVGYQAGYTDPSGGANSFMGGSSGYNNNGGNYNSALGGNSLITNTKGNNNSALGYGADVITPGTINDATAIGSNAIVTDNSKIILGDNTVNVGIGMSGFFPGPSNRLEISYSSVAAGSTYSVTPALFSSFSPVAASTNTGASGLQFRDLTAQSVPYSYTTNQNFLTVDNNGNVVLMSPPPAVISGTGSFGVCPPPGISPDEGLNLNGYNLYFTGNNGPLRNENDIRIGYGCPQTFPFDIKLAVWQNSTTSNSIGINVVNDDPTAGIVLPIFNPKPTIGIRSYLPAPSTCYQGYNVAGWFQANQNCVQTPQYAVFSPHFGGSVAIGFNYNGHYNNPNFLLQVNGRIYTPSWTSPSDSIIKKNVASFNYGLKAIRNLDPISYNYNGIGGFDTSDTYIGLLAENLQRNVPNGVIPSIIIKDTITYDTATIMNISQEAVLYTAVNAIKQLDSTVSKHDSNDWKITGNTGITSSNFIGAIDSTNLEVRTNNTRSGLIAIDNGSTGWGYEALQINNGGQNTAVGESALANPNKSKMITALGYGSGVGPFSIYNSTALGAYSTVNTSNTMMFGNPQSKYNYFHGQMILDSNGSSPDTGADGQYLMSQGPNKPNVWRKPGAAIGWELTGNAGTSYPTNFVGTTDSTEFGVKVNGIQSGSIDLNNGNTSWGHQALLYSTSSFAGSYNVAIGDQALPYTTGSGNTGVGYQSLYNSTTSKGENTGVGFEALQTCTTGLQNTAIGAAADITSGTIYNATAIGFGARANNSNTMMFGTARDTSNFFHGGLVFDSTGSNPNYGTDGQFLMSQGHNKPNVWRNGVSQKGYDSLKHAVDSIGNILAGYIHCLDSLCGSSHHAPIHGNGNGGGNGNSTGDVNPNNTQSVTFSMSSVPILYDCKPNPFDERGTVINYFLPASTTGARMVFEDSHGDQMKVVELNVTGQGTLQVSADNLAAGIYTYSLVVDNKVIDTKRMVLQK